MLPNNTTEWDNASKFTTNIPEKWCVNTQNGIYVQNLNNWKSSDYMIKQKVIIFFNENGIHMNAVNKSRVSFKKYFICLKKQI